MSDLSISYPMGRRRPLDKLRKSLRNSKKALNKVIEYPDLTIDEVLIVEQELRDIEEALDFFEKYNFNLKIKSNE